MRPIRLVMQAFGPFAGREEVDFRNAVAAGLFGIYGPTGAGKSSIFNAITFALFGQAAKDEQPISSLRSDHAGADCLTEIEFIFEIGAKVFYIRRQPDQLRPKARGDGFTKEQHAAWLFDVTGMDIDHVGPTNSGRLIAEKKVGLVGTAIRELLGYGAEQFRQIVLLPQGRFERFLAAKSDDRLDILRELFDVSLYRRLTEKMVEDARDAERQVQAGRELCAARLRQEGCESAEALDAAIREALEIAEVHRGEAQASREQLETANVAFIKAKTIEDLFAANDKAALVLAAMERESDKISQLRGRLDAARVAQSLAGSERELVLASELATAEASNLVAANAEQELALARLATAKVRLADEEARGIELAALNKQIVEFGRHQEALKHSEGLRQDFDAKSRKLEEAEAAFKAAATTFDQLSASGKATAETLRIGRAAEAQRAVLVRQIEGGLTLLVQVTRHHDLAKRAADAEAARQSAIQTAGEAAAARQAAESEFEHALHLLNSAQAQMLAHRLIDGEPCLVCGSTEHPAPASGSVEPGDLEEATALAQSKLEETRKVETGALAKLASAEAIAQERIQESQASTAPDQPLDVLQMRVDDLRVSLANLGSELDLPQIESQLEALNESTTVAGTKRDRDQACAQEARTAMALANQALHSALESVPELLRAPGALASELERTNREIAERNQRLRETQEVEKTAIACAERTKQSVSNAKIRERDAANNLQNRAKKFDELLREKGLSRDTYEICKPDIDEIEAMAETVQEHERCLNESRGSAKQSAAAIADKERPNLGIFQRAREECDAASKVADERSAATNARAETLRRLSTDLANEFDRLDALETETGPLRALASAFRGDNAIRTTLESYAIGAMFDHVLAAANLRLGPMTAGQYRFERNLEVVGGRGKRGLEVQVHDVHTGRAREINTLSGGEMFIAALALALGLSDVVEMSSGKIRLDTIFIDEGFGSLDTDDDSGTLDRVLQVLQDIVGRNRAVGLISHVHLVQQAIPSGFTIRKTPTGSYVEVRT